MKKSPKGGGERERERERMGGEEMGTSLSCLLVFASKSRCQDPRESILLVSLCHVPAAARAGKGGSGL